MCTDLADFDLWIGCKIMVISKEFVATLQTFVFTYNIATSPTIYTICIVIHTVNSQEITLILQPACSDVKVGAVSAHGIGCQVSSVHKNKTV